MNAEPPAGTEETLVCIGQITTAHGVRGLVKVRSFTADPQAIAGYGPYYDRTGDRRIAMTLVGRSGDHILARIERVEDREAARALSGTRLYVPRGRLPKPVDTDEFYHVDLIGLEATTADGAAFGTIVAINDHGAGDVVEIARGEGGASVALPFTLACFPVVDLAARRVVVEPPPGLLDDDRMGEDAPGGNRAHG